MNEMVECRDKYKRFTFSTDWWEMQRQHKARLYDEAGSRSVNFHIIFSPFMSPSLGKILQLTHHNDHSTEEALDKVNHLWAERGGY